MKKENIYDIIIVGGGPAGLTAAIYAGRAKLKILLIEKFAVGGTVNLTYEVKNYPGYTDVSGIELMQNMQQQALANEVNIINDEVVEYVLNEKIKKLICTNGTFYSKTVILCNGASAKKLGLKNEEEFLGKGISYCAICDGAFFRDGIVAVVGGGNTAVEDAIYLSSVAKKVYIICRNKQLKADKILVDSMKSKKNIKIFYNYEIESINGKDKLENLTIKDGLTGNNKKLKLDGLFIAIGRVPQSQGLPSYLKLTEQGYIITNENMETNLQGVYSAGDIRANSLGQIITACSDGAVASTRANQFLKK